MCTRLCTLIQQLYKMSFKQEFCKDFQSGREKYGAPWVYSILMSALPILPPHPVRW